MPRIKIVANAWYRAVFRPELQTTALSSPLRGEGWSTDALDALVLTVTLEFPMLIDDGARERMVERRRRYVEDPYSLVSDSYDPVFRD